MVSVNRSAHSDDPIYPVILSGGSGTRLWPLSRPVRPKQFLPLIDDVSMMQATLKRTAPEFGFEAPIVVSSEKHGEMVVEQVAGIGLDPAAIFLEPEGRNTAAAIALPAYWLAERQPHALMLVMPSDHAIADLAAFHRAIANAAPAARDGRLVTFGIQADQPETGYGYIECGAPLEGMAGVHALAAFVEKPQQHVAEQYVASGRHYWNGGIFLFSVQSYIRELEEHAPAVAQACAAAIVAAKNQGALVRPDGDAFRAAPDISIDYAVMEKTAHAAVVPVDMGWSDVGSWDALWAIREQDGDGNSMKGSVVTIDSSGNLLYVDGGPAVAVVGMTDCVVVSTGDGILVMPRSRAQDVKAVVDKVRTTGFAAFK
ncbi:MAG: mannose-1-phosphate guanylyltransferase/mannose-6-phosphate isomerase [Sphingobium sp.]